MVIKRSEMTNVRDEDERISVLEAREMYTSRRIYEHCRWEEEDERIVLGHGANMWISREERFK